MEVIVRLNLFNEETSVSAGSLFHRKKCRNVTCRACPNMADEEAMVIACTSLVFYALA